MKKILFCLGFVLALVVPRFYAQGAKPAHALKTTQQESASFHSASECEDLVFDEFLEDESDDNPQDPEKRRTTVRKTNSCNSSDIIVNFSTHYFKNILSAKYFFQLPASLFLLIGVLRL